ncbi:VOC family protein [Stomatohabitans albus]|uniref:VOC family protein n=1 Tax=Stomatohabitans albus TaxID=3110766 RepID=UPI00300C1624
MITFTTVELYSSSAAQSAEFISKLSDYEQTFYGDDYVDIHANDGFTIAFNTTQNPRPPLAIFQVKDLEAMRAKVIDIGGEITVEPFDFPGGRRFQFREPGRNELAFWVSNAQ